MFTRRLDCVGFVAAGADLGADVLGVGSWVGLPGSTPYVMFAIRLSASEELNEGTYEGH